MWPPGHSGYCSPQRSAVAAICHETRPGEALQNPGCTASFKITQEEEEVVMEEEEEEEEVLLLLLLGATEDNRRRHMAGEESGQKRENSGRPVWPPRTHRRQNTSGAFWRPTSTGKAPAEPINSVRSPLFVDIVRSQPVIHARCTRTQRTY